MREVAEPSLDGHQHEGRPGRAVKHHLKPVRERKFRSCLNVLSIAYQTCRSNAHGRNSWRSWFRSCGMLAPVMAS
jgi:hypothetical protein